MRKNSIKRWLPITILLLGLAAFFYFRLDRYLNFETLKTHREALLVWTRENHFSAIFIFTSIYTIGVALSIPGATLLTLAGGFLFGIFFGTLYVVISATLGSIIVFIAVKTALEPWLREKTSKWLNQMRRGFQENAFQYMLVLRLVPLFPFWVVNIVPGLMGVPLSTYSITTLIGIIPGSIVYVLLGNGLGHIFDRNETPNLGIIFEPQIFIPLIALALLALVPSLYKKIRNHSSS